MIALTDTGPLSGRGLLPVAINLTGLGLLTFGIVTEAHAGLGGRHLAALLLLISAVVAWIGWVAARSGWYGRRLVPIWLAVMALAGGALAVFASLAVVFVGVAALGASMAWTLDRAAGFVAAGPVTTLASSLAADHKLGIVLGSLAAALAGAVMGVSRRQSQERAAQAALVQVSEARAEAERARAELLAGRNHLARELHDVLAHTLSALSLQLEALDALLSAGPPASPDVRAQLDRTKRLVRDGLDEARGAVQALREDAPPLEDQLANLAADRHAEISVSGPPRPLPPDVTLALYRVAQEAVTNVLKHAPGAEADIHLGFGDNRVTLSVSNGAGHGCDSTLRGSGAGYGLQGIRERVLLIGGQVEAGPTSTGWRVLAEVPA